MSNALFILKMNVWGTFQVVQWLRICQCKGHKFDPWSRKMPPAMGQRIPGSRTREPQLLKPACPKTCGLQQKKPLQGEACASQLEGSCRLPQPEKACVQQQRLSAAKNKFLKNISFPTNKPRNPT